MHWLLRLSASLLALETLPERELTRFEAVEPHMGTLVRITVYTSGEQAATNAFRAAFDRIGHLDRTLSDYQPDSELNEIARTAINRETPVSADLFTVLQASQVPEPSKNPGMWLTLWIGAALCSMAITLTLAPVRTTTGVARSWSAPTRSATMPAT